MLLFYIDKKKKVKKNILALTTMHNQVKLSVNERKKPHALVFYDHTKGGVDVVDLISAKMLTKILFRTLQKAQSEKSFDFTKKLK